jgi:hypothetical protein
MHFPVQFQTLTAFFSNTQKWIYSVLEPNSSNYNQSLLATPIQENSKLNNRDLTNGIAEIT